MTLKWGPWTGKPSRPVEPSGSPHNCSSFSKGSEDYGGRKKLVKCTKDMFNMCELCNRWLFTEETHIQHPQFHHVSMSKHMKMFHPNDEVLDDIDFKVMTDEQKNILRHSWEEQARKGCTTE